MVILGIETSCDETAAAVIEGVGDKIKVLSNVVSSQIAIHQKYGGVVPEVAAREHVLNILPVVNEALAKADLPSPPTPLLPQTAPQAAGQERGANTMGVKTAPFSRAFKSGRKVGMEGIDAIAVTIGPGLITSLMVGVETAKTLAYAWQVPVIGINHIEGHIYANFIGANPKFQITNSKQIPNSKNKVSGFNSYRVWWAYDVGFNDWSWKI